MSNEQVKGFSHERIETSNFLLIVLILLVVAIGGIVEIVPLYFQRSTTQPVEGLKPYTALQLAGRDIYQREGCYNCHSQMIRPFRAETLRYGHYSMAGEFVYDHPFQWGSKRTGPDLARVGVGRDQEAEHAGEPLGPEGLVVHMPGGLDGHEVDSLDEALCQRDGPHLAERLDVVVDAVVVGVRCASGLDRAHVLVEVSQAGRSARGGDQRIERPLRPIRR